MGSALLVSPSNFRTCVLAKAVDRASMGHTHHGLALRIYAAAMSDDDETGDCGL